LNIIQKSKIKTGKKKNARESRRERKCENRKHLKVWLDGDYLSILLAISASSSERAFAVRTWPNKCFGKPISIRASRPFKKPSHNYMSEGVGKRQKLVYADEKCKSFYVSWMLFSLINWKYFHVNQLLRQNKHNLSN
jgi:hypothetical protein